MSAPTDHVFRERVDEELEFDAITGRLSLGKLDIDLAPGSDNREVLGAYVGLVERRRGRRPQSMVEVRTNDIDALSILLEVDAENLSELLQELLGTTPEQADRLVTRLRARRSVLGFAAAAAGVVLVGGIALGIAGTRSDRSGGSGGETSPITGHRQPAVTVTHTAPPSAAVTADPTPHPSIQEGPDGTGIIAPVEVDNNDGATTGLAPAASTPDQSTTSTTAPG